MIKILRIIAFWLDMFLGLMLAAIISIVIMSIVSILKIIPLNYLILICIIMYIYFIYLFVINRNYTLTCGQSVFQKVFGIEIYYKESLADKKICCKKNLIDFFTFSFGMITIILFNKSIGDLLIGTIVKKIKNKR